MPQERRKASRRHDLIADDEELDQVHPPKTRGQRHVGGIASGAHQDAADPWAVVAGGQWLSPPPDKNLEPPRGNHPPPDAWENRVAPPPPAKKPPDAPARAATQPPTRQNPPPPRPP